MRKKLVRHGNSYALVIDKALLELLEIAPDTPLDLSSNGDALVIRPVRDRERQDRLDKTLEEINQKFGRALKKLAE